MSGSAPSRQEHTGDSFSGEVVQTGHYGSSSQGQTGREVNILVTGVEALGADARQVFDASVSLYAANLLDEASRYEFEHRGSSSETPQYTTRQIQDAEVIVRNRGKVRTKRSKLYPLGRIAQFVLAAIIGASIGPSFSDPQVLSVAILVGSTVAGIFVTGLLENADYQERNK